MPKIYSEKEREDIRKRLHEEANHCLSLYGVKKTTVDELVKRVGIPKGTFYLFYPSKEMLLFEVIQDYHEQMENQMMTRIFELGAELNADALAGIIVEGILLTKNSCLKTLMIPGEMELLLKKLPQEVVEQHLKEDQNLMLQMIEGMPLRDQVDYEALSGAFRAIFFASMYPREIGEAKFEESLYLMTKGLLLQLLTGENNE